MPNDKEPDTNARATLKELLLGDGPRFDLELPPRSQWKSLFRIKEVSNFMDAYEQTENQEREPF